MDRQKFDVIVIGGGPSAWAALNAIPTNFSILKIDIGRKEKTATLRKIEKAKKLIQKPIHVDELNKFIHEVVRADSAKLGAKKSSYGDYFAYDFEDTDHSVHSKITKSGAAGGFANVWGATMLPFPDTFLSQLNSITTQKLKKGYDFLFTNVPICKFDYKNQIYNFPKKLQTLNQVTRLQTKLLRPQGFISRFCLNMLEATFEPIGLAVQLNSKTFESNQKTDCTYCGLCQLGCPAQLIWNPRYFPVKKVFEKIFTYTGEVDRISKSSGGFKIDLIDDDVQFFGSFVILATGALGTAEILTKSSLNTNFTTLKVHDNQTYFRHALSIFKIGNLKSRVNLAELTYTIGSSGKNPINSQLYSISTYSKERIFNEIPILSRFPSYMIDKVLSRLVTLLVYFPQHQSGYITVKLIDKNIKIGTKSKTLSKFQSAKTFLRLAIPLFVKGIFLLPFFKHKLDVGGGNHIGATEFLDQNDLYSPICDSHGILKGETRIIIVDTSALPILYPGPITMSSMALGYSNTEYFFETISD